MKKQSNHPLRAGAVLATVLLLAAGLFAALSPASAAPGADVGARSGVAGSADARTAKLAARRVNFGAIALNVQDGWGGWSYDKATKRKAKKAALKHCRTRSTDPAGCKVALWVRNGCGAVAIRVKAGKIVKVRGAIAFAKGEAKRKAKAKVGKGARIHTWVCTTRYR